MPQPDRPQGYRGKVQTDPRDPSHIHPEARAVYQWESENGFSPAAIWQPSVRAELERTGLDRLYPPPLPLEACQSLVCEIWRLYIGKDVNYPPPVCEEASVLADRAWCDGKTLSLPIWARSRGIILHELTHGLLISFEQPNAAHGPRFVRMFIELQHWFNDRSLGRLKSTAMDAGLEIAHPALVPKPFLYYWELEDYRYVEDDGGWRDDATI